MAEIDAMKKYDLHAVEGPRAVWISNVYSPLCKFAHKLSYRAVGELYAVQRVAAGQLKHRRNDSVAESEMVDLIADRNVQRNRGLVRRGLTRRHGSRVAQKRIARFYEFAFRFRYVVAERRFDRLLYSYAFLGYLRSEP